jgi:GT2 family glycosyltransferase
VIIVNYNSERFIQGCLESLHNDATPEKEIIIVDNNSTDSSTGIIERHFPSVKLIRLNKNLGFARANNVGILQSKGRHIILLNPDTKVTPDWLINLIELAESDAKIGILGPKTLRFNGKIIDTAGHMFHHKLGEAWNRGAGEIDQQQYDQETELFGVQFSCALIKREVVEKVGLLDEKMFLYLEDVDYCIRARLCGFKIVYCPKSVIYHYGGGTTPTSKSWQILKHGVTYGLRIILKNYNFWNMLKWGGFRFVFSLFAALASIKNKDWNLVPSHLYAFLWNILNLPIKERVEIQRKRVVDDENILKYGVKGVRW